MTKEHKAQAAVDAWNDKHPEGTEVELLRDSGRTMRTKTRSSAWVCNAGYPVCFFEKVSGFYLLERATPVEAE